MNPLDDLISSSAGVPDVTSDGLGRGRAELDSVIAQAGARMTTVRQPGAHAQRKATIRWWGGVRGKTMIGVAGVVALAAAATVIVLPASTPHPAGSPRAGSSANPTVQAKPTVQARPTVTGSASSQASVPVTYSVTAARADVTAASVFQQAAQATPNGDAPLVNGWPDALYWHTLTESTSSGCPGQVQFSDVWLGQSGSEVVRNQTKGSVPASDRHSAQCSGGPTANSTYPVGNVPAGAMIGGQIYTWAQFAALPTDPAQLQPIIEADSKVGVASEKGEPEMDFLFQTITILLTQDPVSPAIRKALYELSEKIPGVTVSGHYTDSLGRSGTVLSQSGSAGLVVDTSDGQVLATTQPAGSSMVCTNNNCSQQPYSASATVFISAAPTNTEPNVSQPTPILSTVPTPSNS